MKRTLLLLASAATILGGTIAVAQEKSTDPQAGRVSYIPETTAFSPNEIKVMGTLDNGRTSSLVETPGSAKFHAFVFEGNGHDQVDITVTGARQKAYVALADSTLTPIVSGMGRLATTLPYHGPDKEAFYVLVKGSPNQRLTVHFEKTAARQSFNATPQSFNPRR